MSAFPSLPFAPSTHAPSHRQLALAMVEAERSQRVADEARALVARGDEEMKRARAQVRVCASVGWGEWVCECAVYVIAIG